MLGNGGEEEGKWRAPMNPGAREYKCGTQAVLQLTRPVWFAEIKEAE